MPHAARAFLLALVPLAAVLLVPHAAATDVCVGVVCSIDQPILEAAMGERHQCFLLADGDVVCGGLNEYGQANGREEGDAVAIAASASHTCVLLRSGDVDCFGYNFDGQAEGYDGGDAIGVDVGQTHGCALLASGNVACWGLNEWGAAEPYTGGRAVDIDVTNYYNCVLLDDGNVECWAYSAAFGFYGWTGGDAVAIGGGDQHTCVVLASGNVRCWGTGHHGSMDPYDGGDAIAVDGGYDVTCILTAAGDVRCQGNDVSQGGTCGVAYAATHCQDTPLTDTRSRDDGRVRKMVISAYADGACYVLDDATAECQSWFVPVLRPDVDGRNAIGVEPASASVHDVLVATPPISVYRDPAVFVPVRICPVSQTCVGYVDLDPGTGPVGADVGSVVAEVPAEASVDLARAEVALDPEAAQPLHVEGGASAEACIEATCAGL